MYFVFTEMPWSRSRCLKEYSKIKYVPVSAHDSIKLNKMNDDEAAEEKSPAAFSMGKKVAVCQENQSIHAPIPAVRILRTEDIVKSMRSWRTGSTKSMGETAAPRNGMDEHGKESGTSMRRSIRSASCA
jgi:hypothetical protein